MAIKIRGVSKIYKEGESAINALKNVDLSIGENKFVMIIGPSGGGKTTLLNMLGLLDFPSEGEIYIDNTNITELIGEERTVYRRENIGFIFQEFNLVETLSVYENIILTRSLSGKETDEEYVKDVTEKLGIYEKLDSFISELSGGQRQRVAIARSIITKPKIILADEPTGNLDTCSSNSVIELLKRAVDEFGQTVIMVTHNLDLVKYATQVIEIVDGQVKYKNEKKIE